MSPGDSAEVAGYQFQFEGTRRFDGPNYAATEGRVIARKGDHTIATLLPQKRIYRVQTSPMTEAAIDAGLGRDLFVALGEPLGNDSWSMRLQYKPLIRLIWLGTLLMALGGLLAASDRRYRVAAAEAQGEAAALPGAA